MYLNKFKKRRKYNDWSLSITRSVVDLEVDFYRGGLYVKETWYLITVKTGMTICKNHCHHVCLSNRLQKNLLVFLEVKVWEQVSYATKHPLHCNSHLRHFFVEQFLLRGEVCTQERHQDLCPNRVGRIAIHRINRAVLFGHVLLHLLQEAAFSKQGWSWRRPSTGPKRWAMIPNGVVIDWNFSAWHLLCPL